MRMIDADILVQDIIQEYARSKQYRDAIIRMVNKAPTVEPKRGKWIDDGLDAIGVMGVEYRWHKCSQCGFRISKSPSAYYPNFCEACGARMKGADDEL